MRTIAHIINPVVVNERSDLHCAQPVTFQTMRQARDQARGLVNVRLLTAQYPEDRALIPEGFESTPDLDRSILDLGAFGVPRRLPILADILGRLYEAATDAEYLIYSNVDIALMPYFYTVVSRLLDDGYDALVINRRTISSEFTAPADIPLMCADVGKPHPGHDCFMFRRDAYPSYLLGHLCIGALWVGRVLLTNMALAAREYRELTDVHMTFHIGDDRVWSASHFDAYSEHNRREAQAITERFIEKHGPLQDNPHLPQYLLSLFDSTKRPSVRTRLSHLICNCIKPIIGRRSKWFMRELLKSEQE